MRRGAKRNGVYTLLSDRTFLSFKEISRIASIISYAKQNISVLGEGQRGTKGVNARSPKLLILFK